MASRLLLGAALLLFAGALPVACRGSDKPENSATAAVPSTSPQPSPTPAAPLGERIGVRANLPENDPIDLAARYRQVPLSTSKPFAGEPEIGHRRNFMVQQISGAAYAGDAPPESVVVSATLAAKSEHAYFYVESSGDPDTSGAQDAAAAFEERVWPVVTRVFGLPATPGVDSDPRIIVLHADLGSGVGGYYSPDDGYLRAVRPQSNEAEMVYLDQEIPIGSETFTLVLAHELQHLVHAHLDGGEEAWVNEGLADAAAALVGGEPSSLQAFAANPQTQLNTWSREGSAAHYGAGAAFTRYLAHRFGGDEALGDIARAQGDGAVGIDEFLRDAGAEITFGDVFGDWIAANALDLAEGPYSNPGESLDIRIEDDIVTGRAVDGDGSQFGTDYYLIDAAGATSYDVRFRGSAEVSVLPALAFAHGDILWSNREDDIDTRMTQAVNLAGVSDPVLTFRTWFDIEPWYDWGYVAVSIDGGATWRALAGSHTSIEDPVEASYGPGYTGTSGGGEEARWVDERISLAEFAGQRILLRFEYVTDGSTYGEGWAVRDVAIEDASGDPPTVSDEWDLEGWTPVDAPLAQRWVVRLIASDEQGVAVVRDVPIAADGEGTLTVDAAGLRDVVVAVAGATEGTRQTSPYAVELIAR